MKEIKLITPLQAIRLHCLHCVCGSYKEVKLCSDKDCHLYRFRLGHNPSRRGVGRVRNLRK